MKWNAFQFRPYNETFSQRAVSPSVNVELRRVALKVELLAGVDEELHGTSP